MMPPATAWDSMSGDRLEGRRAARLPKRKLASLPDDDLDTLMANLNVRFKDLKKAIHRQLRPVEQRRFSPAVVVNNQNTTQLEKVPRQSDVGDRAGRQMTAIHIHEVEGFF